MWLGLSSISIIFALVFSECWKWMSEWQLQWMQRGWNKTYSSFLKPLIAIRSGAIVVFVFGMCLECVQVLTYKYIIHLTAAAFVNLFWFKWMYDCTHCIGRSLIPLLKLNAEMLGKLCICIRKVLFFIYISHVTK